MDQLEKYLIETGRVQEGDSRLLREVAYERLRDAITYTRLDPGTPLAETRISKALNISRTPIREALHRLAQEGLVQIIPGRAITVAAPTVQEVLDAIHVRELLEPELVRLAATALPGPARTTLQKTMEDMEKAVAARDRLAWSKADTIFHETLSHHCPNKLLGQFVLQARNRVHYVVTDDQTTDARLKECTREHRQVVEAIINGDSETAEQLLSEHLKQLRHSIFKRLARF